MSMKKIFTNPVLAAFVCAILFVATMTAVSVANARTIERNGVTYVIPDRLWGPAPVYTPTPPQPSDPPATAPFCSSVFGYVPNVLQIGHSGDYIAADGTALAIWGSGVFASVRLLDSAGSAWYEGPFEFGSDDGPRSVVALKGSVGPDFANVVICGAKFAACNKVSALVTVNGVTRNLLFLKEHTYDGDLPCIE